MPRTQAVYYRELDGSEPVNDFVAGLDERKQPTIDLQIDRLNDQPATAPPPPFPQSSQVRGQLRELRCHYGTELYRVLYRRSGNVIVLLHYADVRVMPIWGRGLALGVVIVVGGSA